MVNDFILFILSFLFLNIVSQHNEMHTILKRKFHFEMKFTPF